MAEEKKEEPSEKASKEFDIPSPYEDYSNMLENLNTDSDFMQTLSPSPSPNLLPNLNFSADHGVENHLVNSHQSTDQNVSRVSGEKVLHAGLSDPLDCQKCDVMREVMHTNGIFLTVLSIHGQLGVYYHAILDVYHYAEGFPQAADQSYIDLRNQDLDWIKKFLLEYGAVRKKENYNVIKDGRSPFYDVICAGPTDPNLNDKLKDAPGNCEVKNEGASSLPIHNEVTGSSSNIEMKIESINQNSPDSDSDTNNQAEYAFSKVQKEQCMTKKIISTRSQTRAKIHIAEQRKRTAEMQQREIAKYFHLPLMEAAKELQICTSSLKAICRKHGISRWPQRKIKAMDNRISSLKKELKSQNSGSKIANRIQKKIHWLEERRAAVCSVGSESHLIQEEQHDDVEGDGEVLW
ncbi:Plant regulator RWP-RK family protein [Rhynchospora pubera]|uniref:Plant regulator RWP-RK family protein n=1 Tax=Rhynchospora pubera TaxID=906938 RepID=A0AAV8ESL4_9POAL|nr:Plant regulator RWP-RK family protein [Rhynchospora pubera]